MRASGEKPCSAEGRKTCVAEICPVAHEPCTLSETDSDGALADGACEKSAFVLDETQTERVYRAVEAWASKMRERKVERLDDLAARYHLGLAIKELLDAEREACAEIAAREGKLTETMRDACAPASPRRDQFAMAAGLARGIAAMIRDGGRP